MLRQLISFSALATLVMTSCAAMPASAAPSRSDGKCPVPSQAKDPDCAREGFQYRGSGRIDDNRAKSSRDEFPRRRVGGGASGDGPSIPPARRGGWVEDHSNLLAASDRDQFPTDRKGSGGPVPRAPKA